MVDRAAGVRAVRGLLAFFLGLAVACSESSTEPEPVPVASVDVTPAEVTVDEGETIQLSAVPRDGNGNELSGRTVTWASADEAVATVVDGLVAGVSAGTTTVTATSEGVSGTANVTVLEVVPAVPRLELIGEGLSSPTYLTAPPGEGNRVFVTELVGTIRVIQDGSLLPTPFLDLTPVTGCCGDAKGLLGVAFHPDYASNGLFYVHVNDLNGDSRIAEYQVTADPNVADPGSGRDVFLLEQQQKSHVGGGIQFGPDGFLYASFGDGTADSESDEPRNGQNLGNAHSTIIRIDVDGGLPYGVPPDNPFVDQAGALPEIWVYGLRNPWRFSFDRATGDLYIGDVGKDVWEEIDFQEASGAGGENYGWSEMEGTDCFRVIGCDQSGFTAPLHQYAHSAERCSGSVTGGYVYRGTALRGLQGLYFWGDYCDDLVRSFRRSGDMAVDHETWPALSRSDGLVSFGEDGVGELYIVSLSDGRIYKIVPTEEQE